MCVAVGITIRRGKKGFKVWFSFFAQYLIYTPVSESQVSVDVLATCACLPTYPTYTYLPIPKVQESERNGARNQTRGNDISGQFYLLLTYLLTHSLTRSLTHSLTHYLRLPLSPFQYPYPSLPAFVQKKIKKYLFTDLFNSSSPKLKATNHHT